jgi:hypothetical protein
VLKVYLMTSKPLAGVKWRYQSKLVDKVYLMTSKPLAGVKWRYQSKLVDKVYLKKANLDCVE